MPAPRTCFWKGGLVGSTWDDESSFLVLPKCADGKRSLRMWTRWPIILLLRFAIRRNYQCSHGWGFQQVNQSVHLERRMGSSKRSTKWFQTYAKASSAIPQPEKQMSWPIGASRNLLIGCHTTYTNNSRTGRSTEWLGAKFRQISVGWDQYDRSHTRQFKRASNRGEVFYVAMHHRFKIA